MNIYNEETDKKYKASKATETVAAAATTVAVSPRRHGAAVPLPADAQLQPAQYAVPVAPVQSTSGWFGGLFGGSTSAAATTAAQPAAATSTAAAANTLDGPPRLVRLDELYGHSAIDPTNILVGSSTARRRDDERDADGDYFLADGLFCPQNHLEEEDDEFCFKDTRWVPLNELVDVELFYTKDNEYANEDDYPEQNVEWYLRDYRQDILERFKQRRLERERLPCGRFMGAPRG